MSDQPTEDHELFVKRMTADRTRDPRGFLGAALESIWLESDEEDVAFLWTHRSRQAPWWADNVLAAFDQVLLDPPQDLCDWLEQHTGRTMPPTGSGLAADDEGACLAWLREAADRLRSSR